MGHECRSENPPDVVAVSMVVTWEAGKTQTASANLQGSFSKNHQVLPTSLAGPQCLTSRSRSAPNGTGGRWLVPGWKERARSRSTAAPGNIRAQPLLPGVRACRQPKLVVPSCEGQANPCSASPAERACFCESRFPMIPTVELGLSPPGGPLLRHTS